MRPATRFRPLGLAIVLGAPLALALLADPAAAQPAPASAPAGHPGAAPASAPVPAGFTAIKPGETAAPPDTISAPTLVTIAYSLIWLAVVVYLVGLWRRHQRLGAEVAALQARFDRRPKGS